MMPIAIMMISDENDQEFIQRLFLKNETAMFKMAYNIVKNYHTARDMVSESCVTMIEKIKYLREIDVGKQTAYILVIVRNNSRMYLRKHKKEIDFLADGRYAAQEEERSQDVYAKLIAESDMQMVRETLSRIHPRDRELLEMKYIERRPDEEIARQFGIGTASVRFYFTKAKRKFAEELERRNSEL